MTYNNNNLQQIWSTTNLSYNNHKYIKQTWAPQQQSTTNWATAITIYNKLSYNNNNNNSNNSLQQTWATIITIYNKLSYSNHNLQQTELQQQQQQQQQSTTNLSYNNHNLQQTELQKSQSTLHTIKKYVSAYLIQTVEQQTH